MRRTIMSVLVAGVASRARNRTKIRNLFKERSSGQPSKCEYAGSRMARL